MEELKAARDETVEERQAKGADAAGQAETKVLSRAGEKRKQELEERRKLIDAKRRKVKADAP